MTNKEIKQLNHEADEIFDEVKEIVGDKMMRKIKRWIEIELLLEAECGQ